MIEKTWEAKEDLRTYKKLAKITVVLEQNYINGFLWIVDIKENTLILIDMIKEEALGTNVRTIKQVNFTRKYKNKKKHK